MSADFVRQLRKVLTDQRAELREIERKEQDLLARAYALEQQKHEVLKGIMKSEQTLEKFGNV